MKTYETYSIREGGRIGGTQTQIASNRFEGKGDREKQADEAPWKGEEVSTVLRRSNGSGHCSGTSKLDTQHALNRWQTLIFNS